jgi:hypothetical protein
MLGASEGLLGEPKSFSHGQDPQQTFRVRETIGRIGWKAHLRSFPKMTQSVARMAIGSPSDKIGVVSQVADSRFRTPRIDSARPIAGYRDNASR